MTSDAGPTICFQPSSASLHFADSFSEPLARAIYMQLRIVGGTSVQDQNERPLSGLDWSLRIVEVENDDVVREGSKVIGYVLHAKETHSDSVSAPASISLHIRLRRAAFEWLYEYLIANQLPKEISVGMTGMNYGWEPDGSLVRWDIDKVPVPQIISVSLHCPIRIEAGMPDATERTQPENRPAPADHALSATAAENSAGMENINHLSLIRTLRLIAALLAGILIANLFR